VASPAVPATLIGKLAARRHQAAGTGRRVALAKAWATRLAGAAREHLATVAGLAAIDLGCFQAARPAGWIVTGVSVLVMEWKVRD